MDGLKQAQGGVAGQVGVMVNGWYIKFPDAAPEVTNGRTMAPVQALVEAMGGEVELADGKAVCRTDEIRLTFTPGSREVLVEYPGGELLSDGQMFPLDCAPYVKGGQTYVPVRFVAEALGYEVGWDRAYETAGGQPGMRLSVNCTISGGRVSLTANAHVSNVGELKLSLTSQRQTTGQQPVEEPPEGADIVDTPALLNGYEGFNNEW